MKLNKQTLWKWFKKGFVFSILAGILSGILGMIFGVVVTEQDITSLNVSKILGIALIVVILGSVVKGWLIEYTDKVKILN